MPTNENEKYELIKSNKTTPTGKPLFQVKAKINIGYSVKKGELGGYIEKEANLSIYGDAWVSGDALVYGNDDFLKKIDDLDRNIVKLRALGYKQGDIAKELDISQASVSQRLDTINKLATRSTDDRER